MVKVDCFWMISTLTTILIQKRVTPFYQNNICSEMFCWENSNLSIQNIEPIFTKWATEKKKHPTYFP